MAFQRKKMTFNGYIRRFLFSYCMIYM